MQANEDRSSFQRRHASALLLGFKDLRLASVKRQMGASIKSRKIAASIRFGEEQKS